MKINERSEITFDLKFIMLIAGGLLSLSATFFALKADIEDNTKALERGDWVSTTEYSLKDEAIRSAIYDTQQDVRDIKDWIQKIDERIYNLNK